ncbi:MAG TPA: NADH-quinone oxidoreductase subunit C [Clostridia bacterium]|nr:NADH-quinone oxidoreductase subunit C [Clostridia bacterium]
MIDIVSLVEKLSVTFKDRLELSETGQAIYVKRQSIIDVLKALKDEFNFIRLMDVTSADYEDRFEVVYHLMNDEVKLLAVKVKLEKSDSIIPSIVSVWRYAESMEREVYDLMGVVFEGHENLKRILNPEDFVGHPLQKSFKLDVVSRF